jgi:shikimate dehydrogenase
MSDKYGLIGFPLGHSFSKNYFTQKFHSCDIDASYELYPLNDLNEFIPLIEKNPDLRGLNVTIPYKQKIISFLDELTDDAAIINAVNTIKVVRNIDNFNLIGCNTDAPAFESELIEFVGNEPGNALILGTGGASAAVAYSLKKLNWNFKFVSRFKSGDSILSYQAIDKKLLNSMKLIVNTTPVGMYPSIDQAPNIHYFALNENHFLFDLIYNPVDTLFLLKGKQQNAKTRNGLGMLYKQAELAWNIWQDKL